MRRVALYMCFMYECVRVCVWVGCGFVFVHVYVCVFVCVYD